VIYRFVVSFIILKAIDMTIGPRVTEEQERGVGLRYCRARRGNASDSPRAKYVKGGIE
jgi:ammonia channel protein AmtB